MLTKSDLSQIQKIVQQEGQDIRKEVKQDIHEEVENVIDAKLEPLKKDLKYLRKKVNRMNIIYRPAGSMPSPNCNLVNSHVVV